MATLAFPVQYILGAGGPAPGALGSKIGVAVFTDGRIFVSAYGCKKAVKTGLITYWAAAPAVVGVTNTPYGAANAGDSNVMPSAGDLNTIQTAALSGSVISALLAANPGSGYVAAFTA
ncbi:MAG TPA: hypothetical protein VIU64_18625 [Polyangia bacterium]